MNRLLLTFHVAIVACVLMPAIAFATPVNILFVGDSYTSCPVQLYYNNANVTDTNGNVPGTGGIPGIFQKMAGNLGYSCAVSIETVPGSFLYQHYANASAIIGQAKWDIVILQDYSMEPTNPTNPGYYGPNISSFDTAVSNLKNLIVGANPNAKVYLFEHWARPDLCSLASPPFQYSDSFTSMSDMLTGHSSTTGLSYNFSTANSTYGLAGVVPVGDAFAAAIAGGYAMPNPYSPDMSKFNLWDTDHDHESIYGGYLAGAVFIAKITGLDPRNIPTSGAGSVANDFGISSTDAAHLNLVAYNIITSAPAISGTAPGGTVGTAYHFTYTVTGNPTSTCTVTAGTLPAGLSLSTAGVISGTPTTAATYTGIITANNGVSPNATTNFSIAVSGGGSGGVIVAIDCGSTTNYTAGDGTVYSADTYYTSGTAFTATTTTTTGSDGPLYTTYRYGSPTPAIYNIPITNGTYTVHLKYAEMNTGNGVGSRVFGVTIQGTTVESAFDIRAHVAILTPLDESYTAAVTTGTLNVGQIYISNNPLFSAIVVTSPGPAITNGPPPSTGTTGTAYHFTYTASGTPTPTFNVSAGSLPTGLSLSTAGVISGTPSASGTYTGTARAGNTSGSATQNFSIVISTAPSISGTAPGGTVGTAYHFTYTATGSPNPTCSVTAGTLPAGLSLSTVGVISGTPTTAATYTGTITANNGVSPNATTNFSIVVSGGGSSVVVAIDCGSTTNYTAGDGTVYSADTYYTSGTAFTATTTTTTGSDGPLYTTYRYGSPTPAIYNIPITNGTYTVHLKYAEMNTGNGVGSRVFGVTIQGTTVESAFDIRAHVAVLTPLDESYTAAVTTGTLNIGQIYISNNPEFSAIKVTSP